MTSVERVYHVSEAAGIASFEPRITSDDAARVWAISDDRLHNYLLPRDCPRVTFYAADTTSPADRDRFIPTGRAAVVAVERDWVQRILETPLVLYVFDARPFELHDPIAGYYISGDAVEPLMELPVDDPLGAVLARNVEFRVLDDLSNLRAAVIRSSLGFSIIRWRNARQPQV